MNEQKTENKYIILFERIAQENNIKYEYHFKSNVGRAIIKERKILISKPINRDRFFIALHEIGHIIQGEIKPRYKEEYLSEQFAICKMREFKIPLSRKARARSKGFIKYSVRKAKRRGLKKLNNKVKSFIK